MAMYVQKGGCDVMIDDCELQKLVLEAVAKAENIEVTDADLEEELKVVREALDSTSSESNRKKYAKRLKLIESFLNSGNKPEWMPMWMWQRLRWRGISARAW